jgi:hypothetical protein
MEMHPYAAAFVNTNKVLTQIIFGKATFPTESDKQNHASKGDWVERESFTKAPVLR